MTSEATVSAGVIDQIPPLGRHRGAAQMSAPIVFVGIDESGKTIHRLTATPTGERP